MQWLRALLARLNKPKPVDWAALDYGKPSEAGDEARRQREG